MHGDGYGTRSSSVIVVGRAGDVLGYNPEFLLDALNVLKGESVPFEWEGKTAPGKLTVTDKKNGLYIVSGLDLKRDGKWELFITVRKGGVEDRVKFIFPDVLKERPTKGSYSP